MKQFNRFRGTKGWLSMWERTIRLRSMRNKQEVDRRVKALSFWQEHGIEATKDAFDVSRPTLFRWKRVLKEKQGYLEALDPKSTAPTQRRRHIVPDAVKDAIVRERFFDHRIGKEKLSVLLKEDGIAKLSPSTVGRMLGDLKRQGVLPDPRPLSFNGRTGRHHEITRIYKKKLRSRGHTGGLVKADTVVRFVDGTKRYILTALDVESKFAFAYGFTSHNSKTAAEFIRTFKGVAPVQLTHVQTDNGSEFAHHFDIALDQEGIVHFHTYPRSPKQNAEIERFNRTLSEAFIQYHRSLLAHNLDLFNNKLMDWLLWYNARRPHWSLGLVSPLRYIVSTLPERESHMLWTSTKD
jgi:transposase InsO family protein